MTAYDGFNASAAAQNLEIFPLGPNSGTSARNIFNANGAQGDNGVDPLGINVSRSRGGALNFDARLTNASPA